MLFRLGVLITRQRLIWTLVGAAALFALAGALVLWDQMALGPDRNIGVTAGPEKSGTGVVTVAPPTNPATTAVSDPSMCRNSFNSSCGPFRWDPAPLLAPIEVRVTAEPAAPRVGQPVTFTVEVRRDAGIARQAAAESGDGRSLRPDSELTCPQPLLATRYGAWDLPPAVPFQQQLRYPWTYRSAGTYSARFAFETWTCNAQYQPEHPGWGEAAAIVAVSPQ